MRYRSFEDVLGFSRNFRLMVTIKVNYNDNVDFRKGKELLRSFETRLDRAFGKEPKNRIVRFDGLIAQDRFDRKLPHPNNGIFVLLMKNTNFNKMALARVNKIVGECFPGNEKLSFGIPALEVYSSDDFSNVDTPERYSRTDQEIAALKDRLAIQNHSQIKIIDRLSQSRKLRSAVNRLHRADSKKRGC